MLSSSTFSHFLGACFYVLIPICCCFLVLQKVPSYTGTVLIPLLEGEKETPNYGIY